MSNKQPSKADVLQGTLDLMVLQTLDSLGPLHGYAIAARLEQVSGGALQLNMGTLYPALMRLEQRGLLRGTWGTTDTNRKARFYALTAAGRRQLAKEKQAWDRMAGIIHTSAAGERAEGVMRVLREWIHRLWATLRPGRETTIWRRSFGCTWSWRPRRRDGAVTIRTRRCGSRGSQAGGSAQAMEALRDQRGLPWLEDVARDVELRAAHAEAHIRASPPPPCSRSRWASARTPASSRCVDQVLLRPLPVQRARTARPSGLERPLPLRP